MGRPETQWDPKEIEAMPATRVRYVVLWLTFLTAMLMYVDRVCMGTASLFIEKEYGSRRVLAASLLWWSAFTALTAAATGLWTMVIYRFLFGVGEAAAFPAASRALGRWLPAQQRAFGQGFQHAGSRFGGAITPLLVVAMIGILRWRWLFVVLGLGGIVWAVIWYRQYRDYPADHPGINEAELEILKHAGVGGKAKSQGKVPWGAMLQSRNLWFVCLMYFCYGWVFWMSISWLPTYLRDERGFSDVQAGIYASLPLFAATLTNIFGGWISDHLSRRWRDLRRGRLVVSCTGFLLAGIGLITATLTASPMGAVMLLCLAVGGLELTVAVSWAICLDIGGDFSGSVSGMMKTLGNIGSSVSAVVVAHLATQYGWPAALLSAAGLCLMASMVATRIDPSLPIGVGVTRFGSSNS